jgi:IclR family transcriptional regulator, acetate operon repressor
MARKDIYYIEVVGKVLDVLEVFARVSKRQLSLQEISQQLRMNKNAVFRILYTLAEHGYVVKENHKYELGPKLIELGNARLRHTDLLAAAAPVLDALRNRFGETLNLGVLDEDIIRYVGVWESRDRFRLAERVGACDMLHCTALGKAYLSWLPFEEVRRLLRSRGLPAQTPHTITSLQALKAELEATRKRGYALDREESVLGAACVACAVLNPAGTQPESVISLSGPLTRLDVQRLHQIGEALQRAASEIRAKLGAEPLAALAPEGSREAAAASE